MDTSTCYYFQCSANKDENNVTAPPESPLYGALDRFSEFFKSPLFLESTLDRELNAVDSEYKRNLQDDTRRLFQLFATLSNPSHSFSHFSTGNLDTLKLQPEARVTN